MNGLDALPLWVPSSSNTGQRHKKQGFYGCLLRAASDQLLWQRLCSSSHLGAPASKDGYSQWLSWFWFMHRLQPVASSPASHRLASFIFSSATLPWLLHPALNRSPRFPPFLTLSMLFHVPNTLPCLSMSHIHLLFISPLSYPSEKSSTPSCVCGSEAHNTFAA